MSMTRQQAGRAGSAGRARRNWRPLAAAPLLAPGSAGLTALLLRAAASRTFVVAKLAAGHAARLGYATAATGTGGSFVAYAEEFLPAGGRSAQPASSPVSDLNIAVYLGRSQSGAALLDASSGAPLPLRGTTYTTTIPFGDTVLTLTASARTSLTGSLGVVLPWAIALGGLVITILAAVLIERLVRGRQSAERRTAETGRLYAEQRSVAETLQNALLPQQMPAVPGMQIAARYLPGAGGVDIGGDWYDVVPLPDGRFEPATVTTDPRGTLIAYTDGLIERRGESLDAGLKRLQDAAARDCPSLEDLLSSIVTELTGGTPADDIALIGLRWLN